jgi:LysR family transcriptional regulator, glycine cleavage system transcriptional activator
MNEWLPSLNALRAFETVARHLSYQRAAEELRVSPAAVKQLVGKLENTLDGLLLERVGRRLVLTNLGQAGLEDLTEGMACFKAAARKMRSGTKDQRLIVSVESSFAATWLVSNLDDFRKNNPTVNVLIDSSQEIVDLASGAADVAIRYGVITDQSLVTHRLFDDLIFPVCSPSILEKRDIPLSLSELRKFPLIHWNTSQLGWAEETKKWFGWKPWLKHFGETGINLSAGLHFSDYGQAVQAAIAGQGLVLASSPILKEALNNGLLVRPFKEQVAAEIGYDVVTTLAGKNRAEVAAFVEWLVGAIG